MRSPAGRGADSSAGRQRTAAHTPGQGLLPSRRLRRAARNPRWRLRPLERDNHSSRVRVVG